MRKRFVYECNYVREWNEADQVDYVKEKLYLHDLDKDIKYGVKDEAEGEKLKYKILATEANQNEIRYMMRGGRK